jgi:hypothetical protein
MKNIAPSLLYLVLHSRDFVENSYFAIGDNGLKFCVFGPHRSKLKENLHEEQSPFSSLSVFPFKVVP